MALETSSEGKSSLRTGLEGAAKRQASVAFATLAADFRGRFRR
jgi:hypothetical protein